jgi:DNA-binding FadR family transcriptional regulator
MAGKHDQIAASLIQDILSGRYRVGERLPSERDLASRFEANRGAVREAMKKLEQLGVAEVRPGGARVRDRLEASVDVISHMLEQGDLPDIRLVDQILVVINGLMSVAAEQTLELASDADIDDIRALAGTLANEVEVDDEESHMLARFELLQAIMLASNNLPLQLVARSLFEQFAPHLTVLARYAITDYEAWAIFARQLSIALENKDLPTLRASFTGISNLNRETMMRAFEAARQGLGLEASS